MHLETLQAVLAAHPDPALVIDAAQRVIFANRAATGLFEGVAVGQRMIAVIRQPGVVSLVQDCLDGGPGGETRHVVRQVVETVHQVSVRPIDQLPGHEGRAVLAVFRDVTALETATRMRSDFVANVSHELRSPLTALNGFIETLTGPVGDDRETTLEILGIMQSEADRMRRLIDDLLSLSRVEDDERLRPTAAVDLCGILESDIAALAPLVPEGSGRIVLDAPGSGVTVPGDTDQLTQVFRNLIENALKYGGQGPVDVQISALDRFPGVAGAAVRVDVRDHGPGIAPEHIPRLTERFYRVDNHRSRELGGTGLGLAIVKHIVNRHRGRLLISSETGKGSTFSVVLPRI